MVYFNNKIYIYKYKILFTKNGSGSRFIQWKKVLINIYFNVNNLRFFMVKDLIDFWFNTDRAQRYFNRSQRFSLYEPSGHWFFATFPLITAMTTL